MGVGASIGVSIAENEIGWNGDARAPAEVQAYVRESQVNAAGILTLSAEAEDAINAIVLAGSAALALGGTAGVGLSGAGVSSTNRIAVDVKSYIAGDGPAVADQADIVADAVVMRAISSSRIDSVAGAASIAGGLGGTAGVAVSVGVSLAENHISSAIETYIVDETVKTTGALASILSCPAATSCSLLLTIRQSTRSVLLLRCPSVPVVRRAWRSAGQGPWPGISS